jgi:hypothetical protein
LKCLSNGICRKTRLNIIGHSLGGILPHFWPDVRCIVYHLVAFGSTDHGTIMNGTACNFGRYPIGVTE